MKNETNRKERRDIRKERNGEKMLIILKAEIEYFKLQILVLVLLPFSFTIFALNDILLFPQIYFIKEYFWSLAIGMGTYLIVYTIWTLRKKELRERLQIVLPLTIQQLSISRWFFGIAPFIFVGLFIELFQSFLPEQQVVFVARINGQLGMMFMALAAVAITINSWFALASLRYDKRLISSFLLVIILVVLSFGVIYAVTTSKIKPFGFGGEEIYFFIWGLIVSVLDAVVFTKRKSFLG